MRIHFFGYRDAEEGAEAPTLPVRLSRTAAWGFAFLAAFLSAPPTQAAQPAAASAAPRGTQFVFVVDDSRSMRERVSDQPYPAADPDRLSVFAVKALLSMLDPQDEATVVRLNGPRDGDEPPPIRPLAENRGQLDKLLSVSAELAGYAADYTPCRTALDATRRRLNEAQRPNVAQVVFFLTDGKCTPGGEEDPDPDAFLSGLRSHGDGLFRFYLLRFESRPFTPQLETLARKTGGQAITVSGDDPTGILAPFADALTRSQGYEAELLTPAETQLAAYRGARRVRLLAVAPGEGDRLDLRIADRQGHSPRLLGPTRNDVYVYPGGKTYRYASLDYRPTESPVTVQVAGAGRDWKVVAVPEYRLFVHMEVRRGSCDDPGDALLHGTESGNPVCAVISLTNESGKPVERTGLGDVEAAVLYGRGGETPRELPATAQGDLARFTFERRRLELGDHVFEPLIRLRLPGRDEAVTLRGPRQLVEASSFRVSPRPASVDFGALRPGQESSPVEVYFEGNFPRSDGHLEVGNRRGLPSCVTFSLSGQAEGDAQSILPGNRYTLVARAAPYCGPDSFDGTFDPILRLRFSDERLPAAEIGASLGVAYRLERPETPLQVELSAGDTSNLSVRLGGNQVGAFDMTVVLETAGERTSWPGDRLQLGFAAGDDGLQRSDGEPASEGVATFDPAAAGAGLRLRLVADRCCPGGDYATRVALLPGPGDLYGGEPPSALILPVRVHVTGGGFWRCRGSAVFWAAVLLFLLLLVCYVVLMVRNSVFLDRNRLAESLIPLRWDGFGSPQRDPRPGGEVRALVQRAMPWNRRLLTWLRANPLIFGLPGRSYRETVELSLQPSRQVDRSSLHLVSELDLQRRMEEDPGRWAGRLFAEAQRGGVEFFGVPKKQRLGRLTPKSVTNSFSWSADGGTDDSSELKLLRLRRREQLVHPLPHAERREGEPAGWQVG